MGVAVGSQYFNDPVADFYNGNVKSTASQVVYHNLLFFFIVKAISQRSRCGFVDDTLNIKPCNFACILGSLALCVVKVSRYSDNRFCNLFSQIALSVCFQLLEDHG